MDGGLQGLIDFVGYPVGQAEPPPIPPAAPGGFHGLIDFVGYPVGGATPSPRGGAFGLPRQVLARRLMAVQAMRSVLDKVGKREFEEYVRRQAVSDLAKRAAYAAEVAYQNRERARAAYAVVLAEL